jgi:hypothetical protein
MGPGASCYATYSVVKISQSGQHSHLAADFPGFFRNVPRCVTQVPNLRKFNPPDKRFTG